LTYRAEVTLPENFPGEAKAIAEGPRGGLILDLGRVRGTADVTVNGVACGARIWHPYRFDVAEAARPGKNDVRIRVFNTLGPHFGEGHPCAYVFENQTQSGIWGPVTITARERVELHLSKV
jgi:hypothetical protein